MLDICMRDAEKMINYFIIYQKKGPNYSVDRSYPKNISNSYVSRIEEFGFGCCNERTGTEAFLLVFTDQMGNLEFVFCRNIDNTMIMCISSALPWSECFQNLLELILVNRLHMGSRWHLLEPILASFANSEPPALYETHVSCQHPLHSERTLEFRIPSPSAPHNQKFVMDYYNALKVSQWIHIFVCLLLERSVLFHSKRIGRLTASIMTAVTLTYPLPWVHCFYPLLPAKAIEVLGTPTPFIAGIHACNLEAAMEHVNSGTCLVDLDNGSLSVSEEQFSVPTVEYSQTVTPKAIFRYLSQKLMEVERNVNTAMTSKAKKYSEWKDAGGEGIPFFENLTHPFFEMLVNLLGCYADCLTHRRGYPEIDDNILVAYQACPELNQFFRLLCQSQSVRSFVEMRSKSSSSFDVQNDPFYNASLNLSPWRKLNQPDLSCVHQGDNNQPPTINSTDGFINQEITFSRCSMVDGKPIIFGSREWLQVKKCKTPGKLYDWTSSTDPALYKKNLTIWNNFSNQVRMKPLRNTQSNKECITVEEKCKRSSTLSESASDGASRRRPKSTNRLTVVLNQHHERPSSCVTEVGETIGNEKNKCIQEITNNDTAHQRPDRPPRIQFHINLGSNDSIDEPEFILPTQATPQTRPLPQPFHLKNLPSNRLLSNEAAKSKPLRPVASYAIMNHQISVKTRKKSVTSDSAPSIRTTLPKVPPPVPPRPARVLRKKGPDYLFMPTYVDCANQRSAPSQLMLRRINRLAQSSHSLSIDNSECSLNLTEIENIDNLPSPPKSRLSTSNEMGLDALKRSAEPADLSPTNTKVTSLSDFLKELGLESEGDIKQIPVKSSLKTARSFDSSLNTSDASMWSTTFLNYMPPHTMMSTEKKFATFSHNCISINKASNSRHHIRRSRTLSCRPFENRPRDGFTFRRLEV